MNSLILYTNLFTLKDKNVKENKYIDMFYVWLLYVIKYGNLKSSDYCVLLIDNITLNQIKTSQLFNLLINRINNFKIIEYEQPLNIKEGMLQRFKINKLLNQIQNKDSFYIYLDIDVLVINNLRNGFKHIINDGKTTIYLKAEGKFLDGNYYGELATEDDIKLIKEKCPNIPGFTSGIFAWNNSKDIMEYFELILMKANEIDKKLYTIDQPYFNAAVFNYLFKKKGVFRFNILTENIVGHNRFSINTNSETVLLNFCGIPGDEQFHWDKILTQLFLTIL